MGVMYDHLVSRIIYSTHIGTTSFTPNNSPVWPCAIINLIFIYLFIFFDLFIGLLISSSFYTGGNRGSERLGNMPRAIQLIAKVRTEIRIPFYLTAKSDFPILNFD